MRSAEARLAVGDHFLVFRQAGCSVKRLQLRSALEGPVGADRIGPFDNDGPRNVAAPRE